MVVSIRNLISYANFGDDQVTGWQKVKFFPFPIGFHHRSYSRTTMWVCEQTNVIMANLTQTPVTVHKAAYCRCYCDKHNCLQGDFNGTPQACHQASACLQITSDVGNVAFYVFCSPVWDWLSVPQICSHKFLALYKFVCMYVKTDKVQPCVFWIAQ